MKQQDVLALRLACPQIARATKPRFSPGSMTRQPGKRSRTKAAVPSADALSTSTSSISSAIVESTTDCSGRSIESFELWVTTTAVTDFMRAPASLWHARYLARTRS